LLGHVAQAHVILKIATQANSVAAWIANGGMPMTITPHIFEAYLKCPMKCWLLSSGEPPSRNIYSEWFQAKTASYRLEEAKRLLTQTPSGEYATASCDSRCDRTAILRSSMMPNPSAVSALD
jgi:CRISPR/Cas system-associated exonuclease Cas4 (RecB family)